MIPTESNLLIQSLQLHLVRLHISRLVYFNNHKLFLNHLYIHQVPIHPISNIYVFLVLVVVTYTYQEHV